MSSISDRLQRVVQLHLEMADALQSLQAEQQRLAEMLAGLPSIQPDVTLESAPAITVDPRIEFICVGLSEDDPHFRTLQRNAPDIVNLCCADIQEALTFAKDRPAGADAILQLFNIAAMVQNAEDPEKASAVCDRMFHAVRLAKGLGASVTWTVHDLPRHDRPHLHLAHELYNHMSELPLDIIIPSSPELLATIRAQYPRIAMKAAS